MLSPTLSWRSSPATGQQDQDAGQRAGAAIPPDAEARALLHHLLEHGDVLGRDSTGRTIIQLAVDDHTLDTLMSLDADELEDQGDHEPDSDEECDGLPVAVELVRPKVIRRRRAMALAFGPVD